MSTETEPETQENSDGEMPDEYEDVLEFPRRNLHSDGRVQIPLDARNQFGIAPGDVVDVFVETEDGVEFTATDVVVDSDGRVRIPGRKRDLYDLEHEDQVALLVALRGVAADDLP